MPIFLRKDSYTKIIFNNTILIPLLLTLCTIFSSSALAATVNLAWKASTGSNVDGYKMYYGTSSRNYSYNVNVGNSTSCSLSGLQEGRRYYFATTAYNTSDVESDYSPELSYTIPTSSTDSTSSSGSTSGSGTTGSTSDSGTTGSTSGSTPSDTSASSGTIIIDNGDPNTAASGKWSPSGASGYYGANSLYSNRSGDSYSFEAASSGAQEVYLWHAASSNRCTDVPIEIYNGNIHLDTVRINQQQDGGQWNLVGTYTFSGTAKIITVSTGVSNCVTSADAVSLVSTSSTTGTAPSGSTSDSGTTGSTSDTTTSDTSASSGTIIIDNGDPNTAASGKWSPSGASGYYGANSLYSNRSGDSYSFEAASSGAQEVYLWHAASGNRCTNVPIEIYDGNTRLDTVTINQQQDGGQWNLLGTYNFSGTATIIIVSTGVSNCVTSADAVYFFDPN